MVSPEEVTVAERIIRAHVLRQYDTQATPGEDWRDLPEVPNKSEIFSKEDEDERNDFFIEKWDDYQNEPRYERNLPENVVKGPWPSKEAYIAAHYQILREDATASLRNSVKSVKFQPHMDDDNYTHVYTDVSPDDIWVMLNADRAAGSHHWNDTEFTRSRIPCRIFSPQSWKADPLEAI